MIRLSVLKQVGAGMRQDRYAQGELIRNAGVDMLKARQSAPPSGSITLFKRPIRFRRLAFLALLLPLSRGALRAQVTIHVPANQPTIQAGINAASNGDTVLVAPGTYYEEIDFKGNAITVESSAGPATTIIDGTNPANLSCASCPVVMFQTNETRKSVLSGFTIQNGGMPLPSYLSTPSDTTIPLSGGIQIWNGAAPSIVGNIITNNLCVAILSVAASPLIQDNEINNTDGPVPSGYGVECLFQNPEAGSSPNLSQLSVSSPLELIWGQSGTAPPIPAVVSENTIEGNGAFDFGPGGVLIDISAISDTAYATQGLYYVFESNIIRNNPAIFLGPYPGGVGISEWPGFTGIFAQNLIYGNSAICAAGGILIASGFDYSQGPNPYGMPATLFVNNLVANNAYEAPCANPIFDSLNGSQIEISDPTQLEFANNIVVGNDSYAAVYINNPINLGEINPPVPPSNPYAVFDHNDIFNPDGPAYNGNGVIPDPTGTYGNISADPLFVDAANGDYHLQSGSRAIDAGNTSALQQLANLGYPLTTDLDGNPRVQDATGTGYPIVDMGPYEHTGAQDAGATTIVLTPAWYNPYFGTELPLTAQLISPNGTPTGTVTFTLNGASIGTAPIDSSGAATISTPPLALGQAALLATYAGQGDFAPAVSVEVLIFVQVFNGTMTLTLASSPNPSGLDLPVTFAATIASTINGTPAGEIQFTADGNPLGTATIDAAGVATLTTSTLTLGSHNIVGYYPGGENWAPAQGSLTQVVKNPPVTEILVSSSNPSIRKQAVTFTATVSSTYGTPTGTIAFSDGTTALGTVTLVNGVAKLTTSTLAIGSHTITAAYSGDNSFLSNSASITQVVNGIPTVTTVVSVTPAKLYALEPATITATVTGAGGTPTGTVTFMDSGAAIGSATLNASGTATLSYAFPASGSQPVTATYNPNSDPNYAASTSAPYTENVIINDSETSLVVTPSPVLVYHTVTLTATVASVSAASFGVEPYGTVNFLNGATLLGSAALNASGVATLTYTFTQEGNQNLVAIYPGNVAFSPSQSTSQLIVVKPSPTSTVVTASSNPQGLGLPVTFTATVTAPGANTVPVGTVAFFDGTTALATVTLNAAGVATLTTSTLAVGQHSITASFTNTNIYFLPSISPVYVETILVFPTATVVTSNINPQEIGSPVTFTATVAVSPVPAGSTPAPPMGAVTFLDGANPLGTVTLDATGTAMLTTSSLPLGANSITASYTSTAPDYLPSVSPIFTETIVVALGSFTMTISPPSQTVYTGQATQDVRVTLASSGGWDRDVSLSCGQLPAGTTCTFVPSTIPKASGSSQLVIQTTAPSQPGASKSASNSRTLSGAGKALAALALVLIPFGISFSRRSLRLRRMLSVVILGAALAAMSSCSAPKDTGGTPPGVYNISISATYSGYGATLTQSAQFTLTVRSLF